MTRPDVPPVHIATRQRHRLHVPSDFTVQLEARVRIRATLKFSPTEQQ